jgi:hypothetical protein
MTDVTADEVEILALYSRYQRMVDSGRVDGVESLFTPEGIYEHEGIVLTGQDELKNFFDSGPAIRKERGYAEAIHFFSLPSITIQGDKAQGSSEMLLIVPRETGPKIEMMLHYDDEFVRLDNKWLIASRRH